MNFETEFVKGGSGIVKLKIEGMEEIIKGVVISQDDNNWTVVIPYTRVDLDLNSRIYLPELNMDLPAKAVRLGIIWKRGEIPKLKLDMQIMEEVEHKEEMVSESATELPEIELNMDELIDRNEKDTTEEEKASKSEKEEPKLWTFP